MFWIFQVYTGASDEKMDKRVSLGHKVIMKLMEPLQGKGHYVLLLTIFTRVLYCLIYLISELIVLAPYKQTEKL